MNVYYAFISRSNLRCQNIKNSHKTVDETKQFPQLLNIIHTLKIKYRTFPLNQYCKLCFNAFIV